MNANPKNKAIPNTYFEKLFFSTLLVFCLFILLRSIYKEIEEYLDLEIYYTNEISTNTTLWPNSKSNNEVNGVFENNIAELNGKIDQFKSTDISENQQPSTTALAEIFVNHAYGEIKSLASQFLTIVISVIMVAITFSEKIIDFKSANYYIKFIFVLSLATFICALISGGTGLVFNSYAYATGLYEVKTNLVSNSLDFYNTSLRGISLIIFGGVLLLFGMVFIIITGIVETFKK